MAEAKAKRKLQEIAQKWNQKITTEQVFGIYKNSEKYTIERQLSLLKQLFKPHIIDFDKHQSQFEADIKKNKKTSNEAFIIFLNNIVIPQVGLLKPQIAVKPATSDSKSSIKSDFESPVLCSTRVESNYKPDVVVSEVKQKLSDRFDKIQKIFFCFLLDQRKISSSDATGSSTERSSIDNIPSSIL